MHSLLRVESATQRQFISNFRPCRSCAAGNNLKPLYCAWLPATVRHRIGLSSSLTLRDSQLQKLPLANASEVNSLTVPRDNSTKESQRQAFSAQMFARPPAWNPHVLATHSWLPWMMNEHEAWNEGDGNIPQLHCRQDAVKCSMSRSSAFLQRS